MAAICPQESKAGGFSGTEFLTWDEGEQRGYLSAQIVMASSIVTRTKPNMAQCMADRYYGDDGLTDAGFEELQGLIRKHPTFHPSSTLVVVLERECGPFF